MKIVSIAIFVFFWSDCFSQFTLIIKQLNVFNLSVTAENSLLEDRRNGPIIDGTFTFINKNDTAILLCPEHAKLLLHFRYKRNEFERTFFLLPFLFKDTILILPHSEFDVPFENEVLLGTGIFSRTKKDYTDVMLEILPTLYITYKERKINLRSYEIRDVTKKE
jgi:hypothetical protein